MRSSMRAMAVTGAVTGLMLAGGAMAQANSADEAQSQDTRSVAATAPGGTSTVGAKDVQASKVWKNVWHTAPSYYGGDGGRTGGKLNKGNNYFYCQGKGQNHSFKGYKNNWWLKTDDDSGNKNVWVSAVYVSGGSNFSPIPGVPYC